MVLFFPLRRLWPFCPKSFPCDPATIPSVSRSKGTQATSDIPIAVILPTADTNRLKITAITKQYTNLSFLNSALIDSIDASKAAALSSTLVTLSGGRKITGVVKLLESILILGTDVGVGDGDSSNSRDIVLRPRSSLPMGHVDKRSRRVG